MPVRKSNGQSHEVPYCGGCQSSPIALAVNYASETKWSHAVQSPCESWKISGRAILSVTPPAFDAQQNIDYPPLGEEVKQKIAGNVAIRQTERGT